MYRILFIFIFLSSFVFGATNIPDSHIIYTWGYGKMIYQVLEAVAMAVQNAGQLIKSVLLLAFAFVAIKKILDGRVQYFAEVVKFSVISALLIGLFIHAPNSDSNRFQVFDEAIAETYVVERIPSGLGMLFSTVSQVERSLLKLMELSFSTPNSISIRNAGFGFSMEAINTLKNMKPIFLDPLWVENMNNFIGVCLHYNAEKDPTLMRRIITSNDLYNDLLGMKAGFPIGNTISVNMIQAEGRGVKETIVPCRVLGAELQKGLEGQTENLKKIHMAQLGIKHIEFYDDKMQGVANLFHTSHANARNMLQQVMLVHSYRDGIKNMERMYGLGEGTLATTSSIAHYAFFNQMIQQSTLAQKFLPLMKAFLTAIIIGVSWLIIIFSIITGLRSLMMILTMSLFLIFWTPILGLINYLNDLFLEDKFQTFLKYTNGMFGFNINFNTEFFMAIQEHAAIIGYLVMLTPVLAYGLAKGSDMAISSMVSGFTSALSSGARAGALESTKQAQSTKSDIAIGEDISSQYLGSREILSQSYVNGRIITNTKSELTSNGADNYSIAFGNGNSLTMDSFGNVRDSKLSDMSFANAKASMESLTKGLAQQRNASYAKVDSEALSAIDSTMKSISRDDKTAVDNSYQANFAKNLEEAKKAGTISEDVFNATMGGSLGISTPQAFPIKFKGEVGSKWQTGDKDSGGYELSAKEQKALQDIHKLSLMQTISENENISTQLQNNHSLQNNKSFQEAISANEAYNQVSSLSSNLTQNGLNEMITLSANALAQDKYGQSLGELSIEQRRAVVTDVATTLVDNTSLYNIQHSLTSPEAFVNKMNFSTQEDIRNQNLENRQNVGVEKEVLERGMIPTLQEVANVRGNTRNSIVGGELAIDITRSSVGNKGSDLNSGLNAINVAKELKDKGETQLSSSLAHYYANLGNNINKNLNTFNSDSQALKEVYNRKINPMSQEDIDFYINGLKESKK